MTSQTAPPMVSTVRLVEHGFADRLDLLRQRDARRAADGAEPAEDREQDAPVGDPRLWASTMATPAVMVSRPDR